MLYIYKYILFLFFFGGIFFLYKQDKKEIFKIIDFILNQYIYTKMFIENYYKKIYENYFMVKGFRITNIIVYEPNVCLTTGLNSNYNYEEYSKISPTVYKQIINNMNNSIQSTLNIQNCYSDKANIKICYEYDEKPYIFIYTSKMAKTKVSIPLPLYSEEIITTFKNDIIYPYYTKHSKDASFYSLFHIDCKNVKSVTYNGFEDKLLLKRVNQYKGFFNDFGLMYKCELQAKDILCDSELRELKELKIEFEAPYFDEDTFDIIPHIITIKSGEDYIISDRIKSIIQKRNHELEDKKEK